MIDAVPLMGSLCHLVEEVDRQTARRRPWSARSPLVLLEPDDNPAPQRGLLSTESSRYLLEPDDNPAVRRGLSSARNSLIPPGVYCAQI